LIAITIDSEVELSEKSLSLIHYLEDKYPSFLQSRVSEGIYQAYEFAFISKKSLELLRGESEKKWLEL
jgi:hypothetical protein